MTEEMFTNELGQFVIVNCANEIIEIEAEGFCNGENITLLAGTDIQSFRLRAQSGI